MTTPTTLPEALTEIEELRGQVRNLLRLLGQEAQQETGAAGQTNHRPVSQNQTRDTLLRELVESIAATTGNEFFRSLVQYLAKALNVRYAFVGEWYETQPDKIRMLAAWSGTTFLESFEYDLMGTPCINVISGEFCFHANAVQQLFPKDHLLAEMEVESYCGIPLFGHSTNPLGILIVMDDQPMTDTAIVKDLLTIFVSRAAAELERMRAEQERGQALADLQNVMETIPDILFTLDLLGNLIRWNHTLERVTGYSAKELLNKHALEFVPPAEYDPTTSAIQRAFRDGYAELEGHLLTKDGRTIPYHWTGARLSNQDGHVIGLTGVGRDITGRKVMERQGQEQAERFRLAMDISDLATWDWHISTNTVIWSDNCEQVKRLPPGTFDGTFEAYQRLVHPDDLPMLFADINRALAGPDPYHTEHRIVLPGGDIQWVEGNAIVSRNESGQPIRMVGTVRNTTARRLAEEALRTSEARFRELAEATTDWMWEIDAQGVYTYCSPKIHDILGYEPGDALGKTPFDFMPEDEARRVAALFQPIAAARRPFTGIENVNRRKDGRLIVLECRGVPILDADGMLKGYRGFDQDITERKEAERKLRESEERFATAFNEAAIGMALVSPDGRWLEVNLALCQIIGYSKEEFQSKTFQALTHPDDLQQNLLFLERLLSGELRTYQMEKRYLHKEGNTVWAILNVSSVRNNEGQVLYQIAQIQDITERKRAEQLLEAEKQVLALMATAQPLADTLTLLCECCESISHGMLISVLLLDQGRQHLRHGAAPSLPDAYNRAIDGIAIGPDAGSCGTAAYLGRQVMVSDIATNPLWEKYRELALSHGLRSCSSTPILSEDGRVLGTFAIYYRTPQEPRQADWHLIDRMTHLACLAIERKRGEQALKTSEEKLRQALLASNTGLWEWNTETGEVSFSKEWKSQLGFSEADLPDTFESWESRLHPDDRTRAVAYALQYCDNPAGAFRQDFRFLHKDGTYRWIDSHASFVMESDGRRVRLFGSHTDITERKQMEAELAEREERLRLFIEHSPVALAMLDQEMRYIAVSHRWRSDYRVGDGPLIGRIHYEVFPEIQERWRAIHQRCLAGVIERCEEDPFIRTDGRTDWSRWEIRPWLKPDGSIGGIIIFSEDITARKQAEEKLKLFRALLDQVTDSIEVIDPSSGQFLDGNRQSYESIGYTRSELATLTVPDIDPIVTKTVFQEYMQRLREAAAPLRVESLHRRKDGTTFPVEVSAQLLHHDRDYLVAIVRDITVRKRTEAELRISQERYARATAVGKVGVWELDVATGTYHGDVNLKALFGYEEDELSTDPYVWLNLVHPDDRSITMEHWQRIVRGEADGYNYELRMVKKDGTVIWTDVRGHAVRNNEGQVKHLFGATVDITDRRLVRDALAKSERQLRTVLDALPVGVWLTDQEGEALLFNPAAKEIWSSIRRAGCQNPGVTTRWPESLEAVAEPLRRALDITLAKGIASLNETMELECVDGTRRIVRNSTIPVQNEEGLAFGAVVLTEDITTLRQTEADLKLTQFSVDHALEGFLWISSDGRILNANDTVCRLLEYSHEELRAMTVCDIDPKVSSAAWSAHWNALTQKGSLSFESRYWSQTGRVHEMDVTANYLHYGDREYSCAILRDIGERKRAIEALRESEERFSKAFNEAAIGMALMGTDGCWLQVNRALCNIVGYSKEELEAMTFQAVTYPDDLDADLTFLRQLLKGEISTYQMEKRYLHKQGHIVWIVLSVSLVRHPNGEPQHLISQMQDITDRKQAEEALALSERRLRTVLDTLPVGVWFTDSAGRVQFGNPASHRIWGGAVSIGLPRQGKEEWWEQSDGGDVRHRWALAGALSNGESSFQDKMMIRYGDGTTKTIMNTAVPVRSDAGQVMGAIVVTEDMTERTRLAQREAARIEQLRQLSELSLTLAGDPTVIFTRMVRMIGELFKVRVVCLSEIVGQELHFKAVYADDRVVTDAGCCPLAITPCAMVQMDKDLRLFDSVMEHFPQASFLRDHQAVSYCGFPALDSAGRVVAVTCLLDDKPHEFSDEEQDLLRIFGQRIATEFERHRHVAEQQRVADELRRSHAFLRQVIDTDPNFIFAKDREGRFTLVNKAIAEAYGTTVDSLIGKTDADFNRSRDEIEFFRRKDLEVMDSLLERFTPEEKFTDAAGHVRWLQTVKRPLLDDHGHAVMLLGASTDVTARKRVEEMLRQRERDLRAAVEDRERISEDLHDGILQSIFAVGLGLESCRTLVCELPLPRKKATAPLMTALNRAIGQLNHVMTDVRNFIAGIESHVLEEADIGETLRTMVQAMCASNGTPCRVTIEEAAVRELSTEEAYHVMNVMREALSNSLRHSGAGRITLSFKRLRRSVRLSVTDNGKGFIPDSARDVGHGLINMTARARKLGGRIEVRSRPRQGTKVLLDIPRRPVDE